jgi:hypothetical protein
MIKDSPIIQPDIDLALTVLNGDSFKMIGEERTSMNKCCNLKCRVVLPAEHVNKVVNKKYVVKPGGKLVENLDPRVFCGKIKPTDPVSSCEVAYLE